MVRFLAIISFIQIAYYTNAQEYRFYVEASKKVVTLGSIITLTYRFEGGEPSHFQAPKLPDFDYVSGISQGKEIKQFNNLISKSITFSFSIKPKSIGEFELEPAIVTINGAKLESDKITITVTDKSEAEKGIFSQISENLYIKAYLSKSEVYLGEQVKVTFKMFKNASLPIAELDYKTVPEYDGFWKEIIADRQNFQLTEEVVDGERYQTGILESVILFPQKTGDLVIDPYVLHTKIPVQTRRRGYPSIFDDFFGSYKYYDFDLTAPALKVVVKPLPAGKPQNFSGLVGSFNFEAQLTGEQFEIDDAVTLNITVSGKGNLKLLKPWEVELPSGIEDYPSKTHEDVRTENGELSGLRRFEYLMFPRREGVFKLPPISFSYFDVEQKKYVSFTEDDLSFKVGKGTDISGTSGGEGIARTNVQNDVEFLNNDIQFIKFNNINLFTKGYSAFLSAPHIIFSALPFGLLALLLFIRKKKEEEEKDVIGSKMRRATSIAQKSLQSAKKLLDAGVENEFYTEVSKAVFGFLHNKFAILGSEMSKATVIEKLNQASINPELVQKTAKLIDDCEFARFTPGNKKDTMHQIYNDAVFVISTIESSVAK